MATGVYDVRILYTRVEDYGGCIAGSMAKKLAR